MTNRTAPAALARFTSRPAALVILLGTGAVWFASLHAEPARGANDAAPIGVAGPERITESVIVRADQTAFDRLQKDYETEQHQLQFKYDKARYDLLKRQLDERLDAAALADEAKARGVTSDAILADLKVDVPTDDEVRAFYDQNRARIREPFEQIAPKMREYLADQRKQSAARTFYDELRVKHDIKSLLGPFRIAVATTGPARGPATAPVTIVEFADFQCPYCKRAESSLHALLEQYPDKVRIVFRNLPLTQLHPQAQSAAEAAVCADRQGRFWEMHDAMYADQGSLTPEALKDTAKRLGLNLGQFSACLSGGAPAATLDADAKAAQDLGLSGTPYFFINGRPVDGNVPLEKFQSIIAEELHAGASDRG
jgi:predicted DsbA family dithiol-disulfide isomerase